MFQVVSEESFVQIDEFYKLITPNADGDEPMKEQQMAASQHIVKFLEANGEAVVGTTCILWVSFCKICAIELPLKFTVHFFLNPVLSQSWKSQYTWFSLKFSAVGRLVFTGRQTVWTELLYKKIFPLDGQTKQAKWSSKPVNLPSDQPLMKSPLYIM